MQIGTNGRYLTRHKTGVERYLLNLLREFVSLKPDFRIIVYSPDELIDVEIREQLERGGVRVKTSRMPFGSYFLWFNYSLPRALYRDGVELFYSPDYFLPLLLNQRICRSLSLYDVSFLAHPEWFSLRRRLIYMFFSRFPARKSDSIFTCSEYSKSEIALHYRYPLDRICVLPAAVDPVFYGEGDSGFDFSLHGITSHYFLYVGTIYSRRHVVELIDAFYSLLQAKNVQDLQLVIRGRNETKPYIDIKSLTERINSEAGRNAIIMLPTLEDTELASLYRHSIGCFYLSEYEGFGLPVLESLSFGVPTVTSKVTSLPEVGGDAALYVNPSNVVEIKQVMELLYMNPDYRATLGHGAIKQAAKFSWKRTAEILIEWLKTRYDNAHQ